jgi:hypothetical protein
MGEVNRNVRLCLLPVYHLSVDHLTYIGPFAKSNGKEKEKTSTGTRQATLQFGMLPPQPKDKNKQNNPFSKKKGGGDSIPAASQVDPTRDRDPQVTDVMMSDAPILVETSQSQVLDESCLEETQMVEDVDGTQVSLSCSIFRRC